MAYGTLLSHSCATRPKKNGLKLQENQAVIFGLAESEFVCYIYVLIGYLFKLFLFVYLSVYQ